MVKKNSLSAIIRKFVLFRNKMWGNGKFCGLNDIWPSVICVQGGQNTMHHKKRQLFFVKLHPCSFYNACPRASVYGSVVPEPCGINGHQELLSHSHGGCFHLARAVCKQMSDLWNSHRWPFHCSTTEYGNVRYRLQLSWRPFFWLQRWKDQGGNIA